MHNSSVYRAIVVDSNEVTGDILVSIPALAGSTSTLSISFTNRHPHNGKWSVPEIGKVVLVAIDDSNASNVFIVPSISDTGPQEFSLPAGGVANDVLVKDTSADYDVSWSDAITVDSLTLDTAAAETLSTVGQMVWDDTYGSSRTLLKGGNVYAVTGQTLYQRVTNTTGGPLSKGQAVYLSGASGQKVTVALALATTDPTSSKTFGVVAETIAHNQQGFVITEGLLQGFNTNTLTEGALVWLSPTTAGGLTTTKPSAPNHTVMIGVCVKSGSGSSGSLFVKVQNGYELEELHDVSINPSTLANNSIIQYNTSTGLWTNASAQGLSTTSSPTFSNITIGGSAGTTRTVYLNTGASVRWALYANGTSESGSNSGSNLVLYRYNDDGSGLGQALSVVRSSGLVTIDSGQFAVTTGGQNIAGSWATYTPATTNISGGNTPSGSYMLMGKTLMFRISLATGNTATNNGKITFSLPSGLTADGYQQLTGRQSSNLVFCFAQSTTVSVSAGIANDDFTSGAALGSVNVSGTIEVT